MVHLERKIDLTTKALGHSLPKATAFRKQLEISNKRPKREAVSRALSHSISTAAQCYQAPTHGDSLSTYRTIQQLIDGGGKEYMSTGAQGQRETERGQSPDEKGGRKGREGGVSTEEPERVTQRENPDTRHSPDARERRQSLDKPRGRKEKSKRVRGHSPVEEQRGQSPEGTRGRKGKSKRVRGHSPVEEQRGQSPEGNRGRNGKRARVHNPDEQRGHKTQRRQSLDNREREQNPDETRGRLRGQSSEEPERRAPNT